MDPCFVCYMSNNNTLKICPRCSVRVHVSCWKMYTEYKGNDYDYDDYDVKCPVCKIIIPYALEIGIQTRSVTKYKRKEHILHNIFDLLNEIENKNKLEKLGIIKKIFKCLEKNIWFVKDHPQFANTVKQKLREFYSSWGESNWYHRQLFGEDLI
jgi:hypothetical protein